MSSDRGTDTEQGRQLEDLVLEVGDDADSLGAEMVLALAHLGNRAIKKRCVTPPVCASGLAPRPARNHLGPIGAPGRKRFGHIGSIAGARGRRRFFVL